MFVPASDTPLRAYDRPAGGGARGPGRSAGRLVPPWDRRGMRVDVGAALPETPAPEEGLPDVAGLARLAERTGLDCLWAEDRLLAGQLPVLDSTLTLAAAAAVTDRIAIGFSIY